MKSWEKEAAYERTYRSGRQVKNLWKYIPKKVWSGVADATTDSDGYWIWLEAGWTAYDGGSDCGVIHEYNIKDLREAVKTIRKA